MPQLKQAQTWALTILWWKIMIETEFIDFVALRKRSLAKTSGLGYQTNPTLPFLVEDLTLRPSEEIVARALVLHSVVAASCGYSGSHSLEWLLQEGLIDHLTLRERGFLRGQDKKNLAFQHQSECLWVFAWAFKKIDMLDFSQTNQDYLVTLYPDLPRTESSERWRSTVVLRNRAEIIEACDLAYCLHWAAKQALLDHKSLPWRLSPPAIIERRRALEWMLSDDKWDSIPLDT